MQIQDFIPQGEVYLLTLPFIEEIWAGELDQRSQRLVRRPAPRFLAPARNDKGGPLLELKNSTQTFRCQATEDT